MDEQGKTSGGVDLKPIFNALVILLLTGIFVQQLPLGGSRPLPDKERRAVTGIKLDARLWTDPFEAPRQDQKTNVQHATNFGDFGGQIATRIRDAAPVRKVVILPVMVDGGPYFESIEARRRTRYAVVSGLAASGYQPEDSESIQYLRYADPFRMHDPLEQIELSAAERQFPDVLPYEWFQPARDSAAPGGAAMPPVLVLWLEEGQFSGRPLEKLGVLQNQLRYYAMRSVYRTSVPEKPIGDYIGCSGAKPRPTLVEEELAKLLERRRPIDEKAAPTSAALREELRSFLSPEHSRCPSADVSQYLRFLPLAVRLRSDAEGQRTAAPLPREIKPLLPLLRGYLERSRQVPASAVDETKAEDSQEILCDVPHDSYLFQLLRHRTTDFLDALGEQLKTAASAGANDFPVIAGNRVPGPSLSLSSVFEASGYDFRILGPASSNLLTAMLRELKYLPKDHREGSGNRYYPFRFYSPGASAQESLLLKLAGPGEEASIANAFRSKGLAFTRTIATDDRLAESIKEELRLRDIPVGDPRHPIVLIAEWDRVYTQKLRESFCAALRGKANAADCLVTEAGSSESGPVLVYSYLRGLDGEGAPKQKRRDDAGQQSGGSYKFGDKPNFLSASGQSYPWGDDQVDYLQRISEDLKVQESGLHTASSNGGIRAIGLLGSDVYDKLLILRALRPQFPEALFFTTDLDARLLNGTIDDGVTQNLVVASSWGLKLHPLWQRDIPPFRSVSQTSYFMATQLALQSAEWQDDCAARLQLEPQIFEVGRTRFVELPSSGRAVGVAQQGSTECVRSTQHKPVVTPFHVTAPLLPSDRLSGAVWVGLLTGLLVIGCMTWAACCRRGCDGVRQRLWDPGARGDLVLFGVIMAWAILLLDLFVGSEEPFALTEGISIWPTELIRVTAFLLTVFYFWPQSLCWMKPLRIELERSGLLTVPAADWTVKGVRHYAQNARFWWALVTLSGAVMAVQIGLQREAPILCLFVIPLLLAGYAIALSLKSRLWAQHWTPPADAETLIDDLYRNSIHEGRDQRIRAFMVAFLAASAALMLAFGLPIAPFRGADAQLADRFVLDAAIVAYLGLLAVVIETTRSVHAYLRQLADARSFGCAEGFSHRWGLDRSLATPWIKIQWVGVVTKHASRLIVYPFVIAATLALARNRLFDNWSLPVGLMLVFALSFGYLLFCSWSLKKAAGDIRDRELAELRVQATRAKHAGHDAEAGKINDVVGKIEAYREGSYASIFQRPMFKGLLLLAGGGSADFLIPMLFNLF